MAHGTVFPFLRLAFVPAARYPADVHLPGPELHLFYESRIADVADGLPKYGRWPSRLTMLRMLLRPGWEVTARD